jgi:hypothetical protein
MVSTDHGSSHQLSATERRREVAKLSAIKTTGYLISTLSVILLGVVSWKSASKEPLLTACLLVGMATSITGMFLRWLSYQLEERSKT